MRLAGREAEAWAIGANVGNFLRGGSLMATGPHSVALIPNADAHLAKRRRFGVARGVIARWLARRFCRETQDRDEIGVRKERSLRHQDAVRRPSPHRRPPDRVAKTEGDRGLRFS